MQLEDLVVLLSRERISAREILAHSRCHAGQPLTVRKFIAMFAQNEFTIRERLRWAVHFFGRPPFLPLRLEASDFFFVMMAPSSWPASEGVIVFLQCGQFIIAK
jgi:hypothetical protein